MDNNTRMIEILQSETFQRWQTKLRDRHAVARINARIRRLSNGNYGDAKTIGYGVSELRIDYGPGYRVYFTHQGKFVVLLLAGGDKSTQQADIERAIAIAEEWRTET